MTTKERVGRNEALFREVNERILEVSSSHVSLGKGSGVEFVCECSRTECHSAVEVELSEYEAVRENPARFLIAPGHLWSPADERVVEKHDRYWIVEKLGDAADAAKESDPRS